MKNIMHVLLLVLIIFGVWYYATNKREVVVVPPVVEEEEEVATTMPIKLYYYNPNLDGAGSPGGVQCSPAGLVAVDRVIPVTTMPLTAAIELLLKGEISGAESAQGIESEFPLEGVTLESAVVEDGVATITLNDPNAKTTGGSCRVTILALQIQATAMQFPTVTSVKFMPEDGVFQP